MLRVAERGAYGRKSCENSRAVGKQVVHRRNCVSDRAVKTDNSMNVVGLGHRSALRGSEMRCHAKGSCSHTFKIRKSPIVYSAKLYRVLNTSNGKKQFIIVNTEKSVGRPPTRSGVHDALRRFI